MWAWDCPQSDLYVEIIPLVFFGPFNVRHIWANQSFCFLVQSQKENHTECISIFEITYSAGVVVCLLVQSGSLLIVGRLLSGNQMVF